MEKDRKEEIEKRMTELMAKGCQGRKPMYRMGAHHLGSMLLMKVIEEAKVLKADRVYANLPLAPNFYMKQGFVWDETKERCLLLNL